MRHVKLFEEIKAPFWIVFSPENPASDPEARYFWNLEHALEFYYETMDEAISRSFYMQNEGKLDRMARGEDVVGIISLFMKAMREEDLNDYVDHPAIFSSTPAGQPEGMERPGIEDALVMSYNSEGEESQECARMLIEIGAPYWKVFPSHEAMVDYFSEYVDLSWVPGGPAEMEKKFRSIDVRKGMF